ncbi:hypothetical protein D3C77_515680 [compost metagenome]
MLPPGKIELAMQFRLGDGVIPFKITLSIKAAQRSTHQPLGLGAVALESTLRIVIGQTQLPAVVEVVLQRQVQCLVVVADAPVVGLAEKGRATDSAKRVVDCRNTTVEHRLGARKFTVDRQQRVRAQLPAQRRADDAPLTANVITKTAVVLHRQINPR